MSGGNVFVSGANGYIAQHIIKQLLSKNYKVIGSVRSKEKGERLVNNLQNDNFKYDIIENINSSDSFDSILKSNPDLNKFLYIASPFSFNINDNQKDLLDPAINGVSNAFSSIAKYGTNIDQVCLTSAIVNMTPLKPSKDKKKLDESTWNEVTYEQALKAKPILAYIASKTLAEKKAWEFIKDEKPKFKLTTVAPSHTFGPKAFSNTPEISQSIDIVDKLLKLTPGSKIPPGGGTFVDVRDVAKAHVDALENKQALDKRLLLIGGQYNNQGILNIIREEFDDLDMILPKGDPSKGIIDNNGGELKFDDSKTREILGLDYIDLRKSIKDTVEQLLDEE